MHFMKCFRGFSLLIELGASSSSGVLLDIKEFYAMRRALAWEQNLTNMVGSDLESLLLSMEQPDALILLVLQQPDLTNPSLLPLSRTMIKAIQLALAASEIGLTLEKRDAAHLYCFVFKFQSHSSVRA